MISKTLLHLSYCVLILLYSASCKIEEREIQKPDSKILSNRSGYNIILTYNSSRENGLQGTFEIPNSKDTTLTGYCETGFSSGLPCVIGWTEEDQTSLRVIFDEKRYIDYMYSDCDGEIESLLGNHKSAENCGYEYIGFDEEKGHTYKWTFTPEDYDNATPF